MLFLIIDYVYVTLMLCYSVKGILVNLNMALIKRNIIILINPVIIFNFGTEKN